MKGFWGTVWDGLCVIDAWAIMRCEQFTHWTQKLVGLDSEFWKQAALVAALVSLYFSGHVGKPAKWILAFFYAMDLAGSLLGWDRALRKASSTRAMNKMKLQVHRRMPWALLVFCVFFPIDLMSLSAMWFEFATLSHYFEACDDLPPGESRLRKLMKAVSASLQVRAVEQGN